MCSQANWTWLRASSLNISGQTALTLCLFQMPELFTLYHWVWAQTPCKQRCRCCPDPSVNLLFHSMRQRYLLWSNFYTIPQQKTGEQHLFWAYRLHHFVQLRIVWWPLAAVEGSKLWFLLPGGKWTIALEAVLVMKIDSLTESLRRGFSLFPVESISEIFVDSSRLPDQSVFTVAIISSIKATFSITWQKTHTQKHTVIYKYLRSMMNGY